MCNRFADMNLTISELEKALDSPYIKTELLPSGLTRLICQFPPCLALDAERQRLEEQIVGLTIDKTNLAFGLNQAVTERDEAMATLAQAEHRVAELDAAIKHLFEPGPGIAVPVLYEHEHNPHEKTWNEKIRRLQALLPSESPQ